LEINSNVDDVISFYKREIVNELVTRYVTHRNFGDTRLGSFPWRLVLNVLYRLICSYYITIFANFYALKQKL